MYTSFFFKNKRFRIGVCDYCLNCVATIAITGINAWHDGDWMKEVFFFTKAKHRVKLNHYYCIKSIND